MRFIGPKDPQPIRDDVARGQDLACALCGFTSGLERAITGYGEGIVRCRDPIDCMRRLNESEHDRHEPKP